MSHKKALSMLLGLMLLFLLCACGASSAPSAAGTAEPDETETLRTRIAALRREGETPAIEHVGGLDYDPWYPEHAEEIESLAEELAALDEEQLAAIPESSLVADAQAVLATARRAEKRAAALEELEGDWLWLSCMDSHVFEPFDRGPLELPDDQVVWNQDSDTIRSVKADFQLVHDEDIPLLLIKQIPGQDVLLIRERDFESWFDRHFVAVELTEENFWDWFEDWEMIEVDTASGKLDSGLRMLRVHGLEQGLVLLGYSDDFSVKLTIDPGFETLSIELESPVGFSVGSHIPRTLSVDQITGTLYFVRQDYVSGNEIKEYPDITARYITLQDGSEWQSGVKFDYVTVDYAYWMY